MIVVQLFTRDNCKVEFSPQGFIRQPKALAVGKAPTSTITRHVCPTQPKPGIPSVV